jgi:hypothetical protein
MREKTPVTIENMTIKELILNKIGSKKTIRVVKQTTTEKLGEKQLIPPKENSCWPFWVKTSVMTVSHHKTRPKEDYTTRFRRQHHHHQPKLRRREKGSMVVRRAKRHSSHHHHHRAATS